MMVGLMPIVFAGMLLLPRSGSPSLGIGIGEALGCSGGGNDPAPPAGWTWLRPSMMSLTQRTFVPVATDGFFVIDAEGYDLSAEAAQSSMTVEVRDEAGELVPGQTWLLKEKQPGWYLLGWETGEALVG